MTRPFFRVVFSSLFNSRSLAARSDEIGLPFDRIPVAREGFEPNSLLVLGCTSISYWVYHPFADRSSSHYASHEKRATSLSTTARPFIFLDNEIARSMQARQCSRSPRIFHRIAAYAIG